MKSIATLTVITPFPLTSGGIGAFVSLKMEPLLVSVPSTVTAPGKLINLMVPLLISVFPAGTVRDFVPSAVNVLFSGIVPESSSVLPFILNSVPVTDTLPEAWSFKAVLFQMPSMPYPLLPVPLTVKLPFCAARETSVQENAHTAVPLVFVMLRDFPAVAVILPLPDTEPVTEMESPL